MAGPGNTAARMLTGKTLRLGSHGQCPAEEAERAPPVIREKTDVFGHKRIVVKLQGTGDLVCVRLISVLMEGEPAKAAVSSADRWMLWSQSHPELQPH